MTKQILLVDDDKEILVMLHYSLKKLGPDYTIETARGTLEALEKIEQNSFDLIVTDFMMKNMTGVDLARAARRISPKTPVVLMSAYGSKRLRDTTESLGFDGYLDKPFDVKKIREVVKNATSQHPAPLPRKKDEEKESQAVLKAVREQLQALNASANARCVLLLTGGGYPMQVVGQTDKLEVSKISAVIAANFMNSNELANLLGNKSLFRSSFHEGDDYDIYVYDIDNGSHLLAVVFDARRKPGVIWFYTRQTANNIAGLLAKLPKPIENHE